jgi:glycerate kinase
MGGVLLHLVRFHEHLRGARLVVTGEGSLDEQTLHGKAPIGVGRAAAAVGVPVVAIAGRSQLDNKTQGYAGFHRVFTLSALEPDSARSMAEAGRVLQRLAAEQLAPELSYFGVSRVSLDSPST